MQRTQLDLSDEACKRAVNTLEFTGYMLNNPTPHDVLTARRVRALQQDPKLTKYDSRLPWMQYSDVETKARASKFIGQPMLCMHKTTVDHELLQFIPSHRSGGADAANGTAQSIASRASRVSELSDGIITTIPKRGDAVFIRSHACVFTLDGSNPIHGGRVVQSNASFGQRDAWSGARGPTKNEPAQVLARVTNAELEHNPLRWKATWQIYDNPEGYDFYRGIATGKIKELSIGHLRRVGMEYLHDTTDRAWAEEELTGCVRGREFGTQMTGSRPRQGQRITTPATDPYYGIVMQSEASDRLGGGVLLWSRAMKHEDKRLVSRKKRGNSRWKRGYITQVTPYAGSCCV